MSDCILGGLGLLIAVGMIVAATQFPVPFISDPVGSKTFPTIIAVILGLSSLYFVLRPDPEPDWPGVSRLVEIAAAVVVLVVYALALPQVGFVIATAVAAAYLSWRLGTPPFKAILAGVITSTGLYVVFRLILGLSLAEGPLGF